MSRITKLTDQLETEIVLAVRTGVPLEVAAQSVGIAAATFWDWMAAGEGRTSRVAPRRRHSEFAERVRQAEAETHVRTIGTVRMAVNRGNWQAALAYARMRWPKHYAERTEVSGPEGGAVPVEIVTLLEGLRDDQLDDLVDRLRSAAQSDRAGEGSPPKP